MSITADYSLTPSQLAGVLTELVRAKQPTMIWGPPGVGKSDIARQVASKLKAEYLDVRALLLDPVDLRGIPWRDEDNRTRWAPPKFLPPENSIYDHLINFEELPAAPPMVQAALYQLVLDRACGEYRLPDGAAMIACGNRQSDRGVSHKMPTPLASRLIHLDIRVDVDEWTAWAAQNGIAPEVMFFVQMKPDLLHQFDPLSKELAFPCPRTWEFVSNVVQSKNGLGSESERAIYRGTVGEGAAIEFCAFLKVWRELQHPRVIINNPHNAAIPENTSALLAQCGALYRYADDVTLDSIVTYAQRLRPEVGEFLIGSCIRKDDQLQYTQAWINWTATNS